MINGGKDRTYRRVGRAARDGREVLGRPPHDDVGVGHFHSLHEPAAAFFPPFAARACPVGTAAAVVGAEEADERDEAQQAQNHEPHPGGRACRGPALVVVVVVPPRQQRGPDAGRGVAVAVAGAGAALGVVVAGEDQVVVLAAAGVLVDVVEAPAVRAGAGGGGAGCCGCRGR